MNAKTTTTLSVAATTMVAACGIGDVAHADSISGTIDTEWIVSTPLFHTLSLPSVQFIDSIDVQIAHASASELVIYIDASLEPSDMDFDLMFEETADGQPFSMGVAPDDGTLANVASYSFVASGGGDYIFPHTSSGTFNANTWINGPLDAQDYTMFIFDTNILFNGGAIGTWTINYTPVPAPPPGALAMLALAGLNARRRPPGRRRQLF
jgi:hypothetical protein